MVGGIKQPILISPWLIATDISCHKYQSEGPGVPLNNLSAQGLSIVEVLKWHIG